MHSVPLSSASVQYYPHCGTFEELPSREQCRYFGHVQVQLMYASWKFSTSYWYFEYKFNYSCNSTGGMFHH